MKPFFLVMLVALLFLEIAHPVFAAKKRIRTKIAIKSGTSYSSVKLSRPTNSVVLTFLNLGSVKKIAYTLNYTANGVPQGVVGSFIPSGDTTDSRDLYFGTCSKGVCTPHYNITSATLTVTTTLASGGTFVKRYRIKV